MTRSTLDKGSGDASIATLPDAKRAQARQRRHGEIVRRFASFPAFFYCWASGQAVTNLETRPGRCGRCKELAGQVYFARLVVVPLP